MNTALEHPLIASYLRQLDVALARQPAGAAAELSEQLRAHLQEALPPDASDAAVAEVLAALGPPEVVAAAAARDDRGRLLRVSRRMACWVRRLTWKARITLTAIILALVGPASAVVYWQAQASLTFRSGGYGWWYRADYIRQESTQAGGVTQSTVPFRIMGDYVNGNAATVLGWLTTALMTAAAIALFATGGISI